MRALLIVSLLLLASCSSLSGLEITPDDNAMACVKGSTGATGGIFGGSVAGITIELPAGVDTSTWTAEDWKTLAELCD